MDSNIDKCTGAIVEWLCSFYHDGAREKLVDQPIQDLVAIVQFVYDNMVNSADKAALPFDDVKSKMYLETLRDIFDYDEESFVNCIRRLIEIHLGASSGKEFGNKIELSIREIAVPKFKLKYPDSTLFGRAESFQPLR
tara:strand:- start:222 stop:635 length:414 start_codon:yes stop_codon:yes gene_type:complete